MAVGEILHAGLERGIAQALCGLGAFLLKILLVSEGVLDIEQLFVGHIITSVYLVMIVCAAAESLFDENQKLP